MSIHIGKKKIQRIVQFTDSCYYPIVLEDDWNVNRLVGLSFGHPDYNSVSVGWRPCESRLDKIDLFGIVYANGRKSTDYFHTILTNASYAVKIKIHEDHPMVSFRVFNVESGEKIANFMSYYKVPFLKFGFILNPKIEAKFRKNASILLSKPNFNYN